MDVRRPDRDPVAGPDPGGDEGPGDADAGVRELGKAEPGVAFFDRDGASELLGSLLDGPWNGALHDAVLSEGPGGFHVDPDVGSVDGFRILDFGRDPRPG